MASSQVTPPQRYDKPDSERTWWQRHVKQFNNGVERVIDPLIRLVGSLTVWMANKVSGSKSRYDHDSETLVLGPRPHRPPRTEYELGRASAKLAFIAFGWAFIAFLLLAGGAAVIASLGTPAAGVAANGLLFTSYALVRSAQGLADVDAVEVETETAVDTWGQ